ncbi:MAG: 1-deoxy-D-xylulose-5-phosphate reductoisomerase [Acidobacteria bacterium]|nr:1-deoxy-D-xylulose-5-phosphate reductoisomerase [Acidobacteriota bacterium]MCI0628385.1 1-deoxy-D-xylulose-5-phosphate reductoisomerase [Acidobacteriota bacterium]MCI0718936.1 1-deoxy-D-xylulose-5-phosphate reductoisomerase [Acidobacteriota bacterium]
MKTLSIIGSTGSIGRNCLHVIEEFPHDFRVAGLAAGRNTALLAEQIEQFRPQVVSLADGAAAEALSQRLQCIPSIRRPRIVTGVDGLTEVATHPEAELVVSAIVGIHGLVPTFAAIDCGKAIALANKEIMVVAGELLTATAKRNQVDILPVDSEHNAIHQCLRAGKRDEVRQVILTASGGPFRSFSPAMMKDVTPAMALNHPTWNMGRRITIDSATMMNKGFEVLEAKWLFDLPVDKISVLIHPQSTVHSMVEYRDGSIIAQMGVTDMRHPIQYALTYPERVASARACLDFRAVQKLEFMQPDLNQFPCLELAYQAARKLGAQPCALNAADEVAVEHFLSGSIQFLFIPEIVRRMLDISQSQSNFSTVPELLQYDRAVRKETRRLIERDYL